MSAIRSGMARKRRWPYHMAFPNRETPYGTTDDVSWLYRTGFGVSYHFGAGNHGGGACFLQLRFKEYKALIEKQTGKHIKTLRTDNGGEFESLQFEDFSKEAGIKRHCNVPRSIRQEHHGFGCLLKLSGCGISSNTLLIYLFICVYLLDGL
jgi:hypothetical protein